MPQYASILSYLLYAAVGRDLSMAYEELVPRQIHTVYQVVMMELADKL